jgi:DNA-binding MarR family transcriptional regulator
MPDETADIDEIVHQRARLGIMAIAYETTSVTFTYLQRALDLSSGALNGHLRKLEEARLIRVTKAIEGRRPVTSVVITAAGKRAFRLEVKSLKTIVRRAERAESVGTKTTTSQSGLETI